MGVSKRWVVCCLEAMKSGSDEGGKNSTTTRAHPRRGRAALEQRRHQRLLLRRRHVLAAEDGVADEDGGGGPGNPLLPTCETSGGSSVIGGQTTDCATPGNSQITATPNDLGTMGADDGFYGFPGFF